MDSETQELIKNNIDQNGNPFYMNLPLGDYNWNVIDCTADDDFIYYNNEKVISMEQLKKGFRGIGHCDENYRIKYNAFHGVFYEDYYLWITNQDQLTVSDYTQDDIDETLFNTTLYFNHHPMTNAHCHFHIFKDTKNT